MTNHLTDVERAAALLDRHPDYRVLRALPPPERFQFAEPEGRVRTAAIIDVETTGLLIDDPIIDLAILRVAFDERGRIVRLGRMRQWLEDPGRPIPPAITALAGIADADVAGARIDDDEASAIIIGCDVAIAHNAFFDAPRLERRLPAIAGHAWACSCTEVPWDALGFEGRKLGALLNQIGLFHHGHRAAADVWATAKLLAHVHDDGETGLLKLVRRAEAPMLRVEASFAAFSAKDRLKARGYRWNTADRVWWTEIDHDREADERRWLRDRCACFGPTVKEVTWNQRHRT